MNYTQEQAKKIYQSAKDQGLNPDLVMAKLVEKGATFEGIDSNAAMQYSNKLLGKEGPGYLQRVGTDIKEQALRAKQGAEQGAAALEQGVNMTDANGIITPKGVATAVGGALRSGLRAAGSAANAIATPIVEAPGVKQATQAVVGGAMKGIQELPGGAEAFQKLRDLAVKNPEIAKDVEDIFNLVTTGAGAKVAKVGAKVAGKAGMEAVQTGANKVVGAVDNLINDSKTLADDLIKKSQPKVTLEQATGQIIQGKTGDVKQAVQAIGAVDTTGVKTYKDLLGKFKEKKPELLSVVDNELAKDTTQYSLDNLATTVATNSGKSVSTNYVDSAIKDLRELYSTTGDVKQLANLEELAAKGSYTLKEVNDISRVYNSEFGQKAFSKFGDPLTSVNAQRFENTRKGLKDVARRGMGGDEAKKADELLSSVYNTENLVKRNMEAVNKLKQRINERGLFEKVGHYVTKYADILTGGTIRGAVAGLLPRGAGYKVLNALDLEEQLAKNLDIINKALTSKSDDIIVNQLKSLDLPIKNSTSKTTPKTGAKTSTNKLNTTNEKSLNSSIPTVSKKNGIMSSDLSTEAKKYKSAEEFVKSQTNFNHASAGEIKSFLKDYPNQKPVFLTKDANYYKEHISPDAKNTPVKVDLGKTITLDNITLNKILKGSDNTPKMFQDANTSARREVFNWLKMNGYDSATLPKDWNRGTRYLESTVVFDPAKQIHTKSQLEEIWKKANKK